MATQFSPHERAEIHIIAELGPWYRLLRTEHVEGYVMWSDAPEHIVGEKLCLLNVTITRVEESAGFGKEHYIVGTQTGRFYLCRTQHQVTR